VVHRLSTERDASGKVIPVLKNASSNESKLNSSSLTKSKNKQNLTTISFSGPATQKKMNRVDEKPMEIEFQELLHINHTGHFVSDIDDDAPAPLQVVPARLDVIDEDSRLPDEEIIFELDFNQSLETKDTRNGDVQDDDYFDFFANDKK